MKSRSLSAVGAMLGKEASHRHTLEGAALRLRQILQADGPGFFDWQKQFLDTGRPKKQCDAFVELRSLEAARAILGRNFNEGADDFDNDAPEFGLVVVNGLFLGAEDVGSKHELHLAMTHAPAPAVRRAQRSPGREALHSASNREMAKQLQFELTAAALAAIYHPTFWPEPMASGLDEEGEVIGRFKGGLDDRVTPDVVMVWYSQVVAYLRKAQAQVALEENPAILQVNVHHDATRAGVVPNPNRSKPDRAATVREVIAGMAPYFHRRLPLPRTLAKPVEADTNAPIVRELTQDQLFSAALHGAPLDQNDPFNEANGLVELAYWIGGLKRKRQEVLTVDIARRLLHPYYWDPEFFVSLFSETVWHAIDEAARIVLANGEALPVEYRWTRDLETPWFADLNPQRLTIQGPMLNFPVFQLRYWKEKTATARATDGFLI